MFRSRLVRALAKIVTASLSRLARRCLFSTKWPRAIQTVRVVRDQTAQQVGHVLPVRDVDMDVPGGGQAVHGGSCAGDSRS